MNADETVQLPSNELLRQQLSEALDRINKSGEGKSVLKKSGIDGLTLRRWIDGDTKPRLDNIHKFFQVCTEESQAILRPLIDQLYPSFFIEPEPEPEPEPSDTKTISNKFIFSIVSAVSETSESLLLWTICSLLLDQILQHLDTNRNGMSLSIFQCVDTDGVVQCLSEDIGMVSYPTHRDLEIRQGFVGEESLPGRAISQFKASGIPILVSQDENKQLINIPLLRSGKIGGCLQVQCFLEYALSSLEQSILKDYSKLLSLALDANKFFSEINLIIMPPIQQQISYLATLQNKKIEIMKSLHITKEEAERRIQEETITYLSQLALQ